MTCKWTISQFHDRRDMILTSRMAVSNIFLTVTVILNLPTILLMSFNKLAGCPVPNINLYLSLYKIIINS